MLIIGYSLEVSKLGVATAQVTGQAYLPVYKLAPFRILVVLIGVVLAFIFTVFPYPILSKDILRRDVSKQFHLLSDMFALTQARLGIAAAWEKKDVGMLTRALQKVSIRIIALQALCQANLINTSFEINLHYRFPKEIYGEILSSMQRLNSQLSLTDGSLYELFILQNDAISRLAGDWLRSMTQALGVEFFQMVAHHTISRLNILSGSLWLNSPLPPFHNIPRSAHQHVLGMERMPEEMGLKHVGETGYAVFATMSVSSLLADQQLENCMQQVRKLVGEVDLEWT